MAKNPCFFLQLDENCVYFIPRGVVHQFRTLSACASIAWYC
jgi:dTDP-4-dehydrorhamnose 3,5-epimerase-like enzyme